MITASARPYTAAEQAAVDDVSNGDGKIETYQILATLCSQLTNIFAEAYGDAVKKANKPGGHLKPVV